jgi:alpha-L-fucosidase
MRKLLLILLAATTTLANAQTNKPSPNDLRMKWWKEARFGLFLHWGSYAVPAGTWKGKTGYAEWIREEAHIPVTEYEKFAQEFNPVNFDAEKWVTMAKNAGMKYIVITSKHHEGFNMFASKFSDYSIMNTPFHRDPMKELAAACKRHGLKFCFYHSIMDWHHPDYLPRRSWEDRPVDGADFDRYVKYLRNEVKQLLTDYGPIGVMWFDGEWENTWNHKYGQALYDLCRQVQPNVIVNNRVDVGRAGVAGMSTMEGTAGDFGTPEQEIPAQGLPGSYWETCMTMNDHWGYNKNDHNYKSAEDLIRKLVDIASKGGNFLLNIGPTAQGEFPPQAQDRLKALGNWMGVNSNAIYATDASPFPTLPWGRCTQVQKGNRTRLYLEVFDWPANGKLVVPGIGNRALGASMLAGHSALAVERHEGDLVIDVPPTAPDKICSVIALEVEGKPVIYRAPVIDAATSLVYQPVSVKLDPGSTGLTVRYTLDGTDPIASSPAYTGPIVLTDAATLKARTFDGEKPVSTTTVEEFTKASPQPAVSNDAATAGLQFTFMPGNFEQLSDLDSVPSGTSGTVTGVNLDLWPNIEHFGAVMTGYLSVPTDGVYLFEISSDDGSCVTIGDTKVVINDGLHSMSPKTGEIALAKGLHPIKISYFNGGGGQGLSLKLALAGAELKPVESSALMH